VDDGLTDTTRKLTYLMLVQPTPFFVEAQQVQPQGVFKNGRNALQQTVKTFPLHSEQGYGFPLLFFVLFLRSLNPIVPLRKR
jgi:hypothetical protein